MAHALPFALANVLFDRVRWRVAIPQFQVTMRRCAISLSVADVDSKFGAARSVQRSEMERAERTDAVADELQPRPHARSQSGRSVFSQHVPVPLHAPAVADSVERDQGAKEEGLGVRVRDLHYGARVGNPFADSCEVGREATE
jgi:hypothetical protein